jgi:hypothetical protein
LIRPGTGRDHASKALKSSPAAVLALAMLAVAKSGVLLLKVETLR